MHWKKSHNFIHHKYTNVVGLDDDIGYGIMRLTRDQRWEKWMIGNPVYNFLLGTLFEWGVALHGVETTKWRKGEKQDVADNIMDVLAPLVALCGLIALRAIV